MQHTVLSWLKRYKSYTTKRVALSYEKVILKIVTSYSIPRKRKILANFTEEKVP